VIPTDILEPAHRRPSKAYLVNELRKAVHTWRDQDYQGITDTTRRLLQFWFEEDHLIDNEPFRFWFCQREAIETLIYVYEVMKKRNFIDIARDFGSGPIQGYDPTYDQYPLYAFKMATGSGKTLVMILATVWSYFNHKKENKEDYTSKFLLISPNVIVYDRLRRDFQDGQAFKEYPFLPPEWSDDFDLKIILREDPIQTIPEDVLFLTNIQQLEDRKSQKEEVEEYVDDMLVLEGVKKHDIYQENRIKEVLTFCPNIMILKDEAHHIYNFEKAWKKILMNLHRDLKSRYGKGINAELDFSATPKTESGALIPWIIVDFALAEAIEMNIVKRPMKGIVKGAREIASKNAFERYGTWIDAGVRRWREYKENLIVLHKQPILFVMCEDTNAANEVYEYLNSFPDLKNRILLIHTNLKGDIVKKDLDKARKAARLIDTPESPEIKEIFPDGIGAIVSVMMLNEGWDVRNVNVIVGIRSYASKRKVLPEQVIGRGLRKMFPDEEANTEKGINALEVIGPPGLIEILEDLEQQEGVTFSEFDTEQRLNLTTIFVDEDKMDKDMEIPILTPMIMIRQFSLEGVDVDSIPSLGIPLENKVLETEYIAVDMLEGVEVVKRRWDLPAPKDSKSVIAYYTDQILKQLKISSAFSSFYPLVKKYVIGRLFDTTIDLDDPRVLYKMSSPEVQEKLINLFVSTFKDLTFTEREPEMGDFIKLSDTRPFPWSKLVYPADNCIFNYAPCDNDFEMDFARFLDRAEDVMAFCKIVPKIGFFVEYRDSKGNLRLYHPDFVVVTKPGENFVIETKGRVDIDVKHKDDRIKRWCDDASGLTGDHWKFIRINQEEFEKHRFKSIEELLSAIAS
jgi:type III restriction enzyme